jgi:chromosomal replication initiator protein
VNLPDEVARTRGAHQDQRARAGRGAAAPGGARLVQQPGDLDRGGARALAKLIASTPNGLTIEAIQREVAGYFDVKLHDMKGPKRHRAIAHPRMVAMYLARKLTKMSFPEIGGRFGGKDHSTVISARKIERLCGEDPTVRSVVGARGPSAPTRKLLTGC